MRASPYRHSDLDTEAIRLVKDLYNALWNHHMGLTTTEPFARTYDRDHDLLNLTKTFLRGIEGGE